MYATALFDLRGLWRKILRRPLDRIRGGLLLPALFRYGDCDLRLLRQTDLAG